MTPTDLLLNREEVEIVETWMTHWFKTADFDAKSVDLMWHIGRFLHPRSLSADQQRERCVVYYG